MPDSSQLNNMIAQLETQLDSFDTTLRSQALDKLIELADSGQISLPQPGRFTNVHFHSFYSYNYKGYSPSKIAWMARRAGLEVAGLVDFDVFDGIEEFFAAAEKLNLKAVAKLETRTFCGRFADKQFNSPGEPGIVYQLAAGIATGENAPETADFLGMLKETATQRNLDLIERVNNYLAPVKLDFDTDIRPLTPAGNATERHICLAYARKAAKLFSPDSLINFWAEKLKKPAAEIIALDLPLGGDLQNLIRAVTMKQGGVGYVQPDEKSFPDIEKFNEFAKAAQGIPTAAWLNGLTDGEQDADQLLDGYISLGTEAFCIIPDRNFTPGKGTDDVKYIKLKEVIDAAMRRDMPIIVGTEMNSPGQRFIDNFESEELAPYVDIFGDGARIFYAHTALQRYAGMGYLSDWAKKNFESKAEKNRFFSAIGKTLEPANHKLLSGLDKTSGPEEVLEAIKQI